MQMAATDAVDISQEPQHIHELYGTEPGKESFANNCLLARRLVERGVRYVQLFDWGWDSHGAAEFEALNKGFQDKCRQIDRPTAALLIDLEQRGLLDGHAGRSGAANSAARRCAKTAAGRRCRSSAATIIRTRSRFLWPAAA